MEANEYNKSYYSILFSTEADGYYLSIRKKIEIVLKMLDGNGGKILDVGCGDGYISKAIAEKTSAEVYGVDVSPDLVSAAKKRGVKAMVCDLECGKLPYKDSFFDAIFCGDVLEHIFDTESLLAEMNRVLKPDGFLILSIPNIAAWYNRILLPFGYLPAWIESGSKTSIGTPFISIIMGHVKAFTKNSITKLLKIHGFHIESLRGSPVYCPNNDSGHLEKIWNRADSFFSRIPQLSSLIIIKARKNNFIR